MNFRHVRAGRKFRESTPKPSFKRKKLRLRKVKWLDLISQLGKGRARIWLEVWFHRSYDYHHWVLHVWKSGSMRKDRIYKLISLICVGVRFLWILWVLWIICYMTQISPGIVSAFRDLCIISLDPCRFIAFGNLKLSPQFLIPRSYTLMVPLLCLSGGHLDLPCQLTFACQSGCKAPSFQVFIAHAFTKHFECWEGSPYKPQSLPPSLPSQPCPLIAMPCLSPQILLLLFCRIGFPFLWSQDIPGTWQLWESHL